MSEDTTPALVEIRRSQLKPGTTGQHTNGRAPAWVSINGGPWRRVRARGYASDHRLVRDLEELLEVEPEEECNHE
jgi:hypothetical protein